jgi:hypothetical protein
MKKPWDLDHDNELKLLNKGFIQIAGDGAGMHHVYEWTSESFKVGLYYDRGNFDCCLIPNKEPKRSLLLIWLLKYIYNDLSFYDNELKKADQWDTLTSNEYFHLLLKHYPQIESFFERYDFDSYNRWNQFVERNKSPLM